MYVLKYLVKFMYTDPVQKSNYYTLSTSCDNNSNYANMQKGNP